MSEKIPDWPSPSPVFVIDGIPTLPLKVIHARTLEAIQPFSSGKVEFVYKDPEYESEPYDLSPEWLHRVGSDANTAITMTKSWKYHISNYKYFVQIRDDPSRHKVQAL